MNYKVSPTLNHYRIDIDNIKEAAKLADFIDEMENVEVTEVVIRVQEKKAHIIAKCNNKDRTAVLVAIGERCKVYCSLNGL